MKVKSLQIVLLLSSLSFVFWISSWIFSFKFNPQYWENYYYTSQWNIPNSPRIISDEGVYRYVGFRLVNGENPFNIDYWVPPLGKYIYGFFAAHFGNPYFASLLFYLSFILVFYLLSKQLFKNSSLILISLLLLILNPLVIFQLQQTMLDLPLALFFLISVLFFVNYLQSSDRRVLMLSGFFLGLMAGTKPPLFSLVLLFFITFWLIVTTKNIKQVLLYSGFFFLGYLSAYFCYFLKHPNPIPWLRLHQKVIDFQVNQKGTNFPFNLIQSILLRSTTHYNNGIFPFKEWSLLLPTGLLSALVIVKNIFNRQKQNKSFLFLLGVFLVYIITCSLVDFWPRYFIPIIPLFVIFTVTLFKSKPIFLWLILISYLPLSLSTYWPDPGSTLKTLSEYVSRGQIQEIEVMTIGGYDQIAPLINPSHPNQLLVLEPPPYSPFATQSQSLININGQLINIILNKHQNQWFLYFEPL